MIDDNGHRQQEQLREHPSVTDVMAYPFPLKGNIESVYFKDDLQNNTQQTVADVLLLGGMSKLTGVTISTPKANGTSGEEWTPEVGDVVIVQLLNGRWTEPIITGFINMPDNLIQATSKQVPSGKRRYHMRCNKTSVEIDKDGNRIVTVAKNDTLTVKGDGKITVTGKLEIEVTNNVTITVKGNATINAANVNVTGTQAVTVTTPLLTCTGNIKAAGTITAAVIADLTGPMALLRATYAAHTHAETGTGGGITGPPIGG